MQFSAKQYEYIAKANRRWNFKIGAVRSGKTYVDLAAIIPYRLRKLRDEAGLNFILGVSKETIERNVLEPMRALYTDQLVSTINSRNIARICGVPVYCLGAEKVSQVSKLQGSSVKYVYGDEVARWSKEVFAMLQSRLDKPYSCFDGSCNPESPNHWLKEFIDNPAVDLYLQKYTLFDNPFLSQEFIDNICAEYAGTVYYGRYVEGEWTQAEGLVYPMYLEALGDVPEEEQDKQYEHCLSIDYGTQNAFAAILWRKQDGAWWAVKEYYYSGRKEGAQKTDEEYAEDMDVFIGDIPRIRTYIDPSAASFIALLRKRGHKYKVIPADNAVADGLRETAVAMRKGLIKIDNSLKNWKKEIQGYVWDDKATEDRPIKEDDHLMDAMRYFVKTQKVARVRTQYNPIWQ